MASYQLFGSLSTWTLFEGISRVIKSLDNARELQQIKHKLIVVMFCTSMGLPTLASVAKPNSVNVYYFSIFTVLHL